MKQSTAAKAAVLFIVRFRLPGNPNRKTISLYIYHAQGDHEDSVFRESQSALIAVFGIF